MGEVDQFIGHCLIPLDPWVIPIIELGKIERDYKTKCYKMIHYVLIRYRIFYT